jgi:hypothetical protein
MPLPIPRPQPQPTPPVTPGRHRSPSGGMYYVRQRQDWAIGQEVYRHNQALYIVGEWAVFFLMWTLLDFQQNLVGRCQRCYQAGTDLENRAAAVYNQPTQKECPDCFGTTFEGGFRARIVRPTIFADTDETEQTDKRGAVHPDDVSVESTADFRVRAGDYVLRADGSRWRLPSQTSVRLRTGFEHPSQAATALTLNRFRATLEEPTTVAYLLPPVAKTDLRILLDRQVHYAEDFGDFEVIRAPLIPPSTQD